MAKTIGMGTKVPQKDDVSKLQKTVEKLGAANKALADENKALKTEIAELKEPKKE